MKYLCSIVCLPLYESSKAVNIFLDIFIAFQRSFGNLKISILSGPTIIVYSFFKILQARIEGIHHKMDISSKTMGALTPRFSGKTVNLTRLSKKTGTLIPRISGKTVTITPRLSKKTGTLIPRLSSKTGTDKKTRKV